MDRIRSALAALALFFPAQVEAQSFLTTTIAADASIVWRDYNINGVAGSGLYNPKKSDIRQIGAAIGNGITQLQGSIAAGSLGYLTQAAINADLAHGANTIATVWADGVSANNGVYIKTGSSGSGSWTQVSSSLFGLLPTWTIGTVTMTAPGSTPTVTLAGSPAAPVLNFSLPASPVISLGTVTTLSSGTPASASITGTPTAPIINLSIPRGVDGSNSFAWRGTWSSATTYAVNDCVSYNGASYIAVAGNTNVTPTAGATWNVLASGPRLQMDNLTVTATNTLSSLSQSQTGGLMILLVNGQAFTSAGGSPPFSVSGTAITWVPTIAGFNLQTATSVQAIYTY